MELNYDMDSDYSTMEYEYKLHINIKSKENIIYRTLNILQICIDAGSG